MTAKWGGRTKCLPFEDRNFKRYVLPFGDWDTLVNDAS